MITHYDILGLSFEASPEEVRRAYRQRVFDLHPDRNPQGADSEALKRVQQAYDVLKDAVQRAEYDLSLKEAAVSAPQGKAPRQPLHWGKGWEEHLGLGLVLLVAPLFQVPTTTLFFLVLLTAGGIFLGNAVLFLRQFGNSSGLSEEANFELRITLLSLFYLVGWFAFNPGGTQSTEDLVFSLAFGQLVGEGMIGASFRIRSPTWSLPTRVFASVAAGFAASLVALLQLTMFLGKNEPFQIWGAGEGDWLFLGLTLLAGSALTSLSYGLWYFRTGVGRGVGK